MPALRELARLEAVLGHRFVDKLLLDTAVTHRSYANEQVELECTDNERLELLGDAVLDLIITHMLMSRYPRMREGQLSVTRAQVVSETSLAALARNIGLGEWLLLGKGELRSGGRDKPSILADALEAVIAAVYMDGGYHAAWSLVTRLFSDTLAGVEEGGGYDYKTRLQELAHARLKANPVYHVSGESGPDHAKVFEVCVEIDGQVHGQASAPSKKRAEQLAARSALAVLEPEPSAGPGPDEPGEPDETD